MEPTPELEELKSKLQELENVGALSHASALYELGEAAMESQDVGARDILISGARSCGDWINEVIPIEKRGDAQYAELFNLASLVDFKLKMAGGMRSRALAIIAADDTCEIALRRMASFIHLRRTGDKAAAEAMLAVKPSSGYHDVAPLWLVSEVSTYSHSEFKRRRIRGALLEVQIRKEQKERVGRKGRLVVKEKEEASTQG